MSDLGDILEVMISSNERFNTVAATVREWRDPALDEDSREQLRVKEGHPNPFPFPRRHRPKPFETRTRLWYRPPDHYRMEREMPDWLGGASTTIKNGPEWWTVYPDGEVMTNGGRRDSGTGPGPDIYLDPTEVVTRIALRVVGHDTKAGRPAVHLEGHLRPHPVQGYMYNIPIGADLYDFLVDAQIGLLLRVEARYQGRPLMISEVTEIAYDGVADEVFAYVPPPGVRLRRTDDEPTAPVHVSLDEAARRAPFKVFTPTRIPEGGHMTVSFDSGEGRAKRQANIHVHYNFLAARHHLSLQESAVPGDLPTPRDHGAERVVHAGQEMFYWAQPGNNLVYLERQGTGVTILADLSRDMLLEIADSLEAASTEPPRLVPA